MSGLFLHDEDPECRAQRLAKYARYRASMKGWQRMLRYNASPAKRLASQRYRDTHPSTPASYQLESGGWRHPVRVEL